MRPLGRLGLETLVVVLRECFRNDRDYDVDPKNEKKTLQGRLSYLMRVVDVV